MALPTYVGSGTFGASIGTLTPAWPAQARQANDIALLVVESENQTISLSDAQSFVQVANSPQGTGTAGSAGSTRIAVYWRRLSGASDTAPTIADAGDHVTGQLHVFRGCKTSGDPWDYTTGAVDTVADFSGTCPGGTTLGADRLLVLLCSSSRDTISTTSFNPPTNTSLTSITERTDNVNSVGLGGGHQMSTGAMLTAGTVGTTTFLIASGATLKGMMTIALAPAATGHLLVAEAGSYAATGVAAGLLLGHVIAAASGAYALSGTDAGTFKGAAVIAESGSYAITGTEANLVYTPANNKLIVADPGSYSVTGTAAGVLLGREVVADSGSYSATGTDANLLDARKIPADSGSYTQTGTDASLERGFLVAAAGGSYVLTGQDAQLVYEPANAYIIAAAGGAYAATGSDAALLKGAKVAADSGAYVVTGSSVDLIKAVPASPIPVHRAIVRLPDPHVGSSSVQYKAGASIMDTYTTSNDEIRTSNDHLRTSDMPMRYV